MTVRTILVAHDFSDTASRALRFAAQLADVTGATLVLAHVHPDPSEQSAALTALDALPGQTDRYLRFLGDELERVGAEALGRSPGTLPCHVRRGDPVRCIEELGRELAADVICVGATGKGTVARVLLGSVSQLLMRSAAVPVLLVP